MQSNQPILKLRLLSWALVLLAVGGLLLVFLGQANISRQDVAAIALQAKLEAEVGTARADLLRLQAAMREALEAPTSSSRKDSLQKAETAFLKALTALQTQSREWPDLSARAAAAEEQYRTRMQILGAKVLELAGRDTKAALDLFLSAYGPAGELINGLMGELLDIGRRHQEQQVFHRANYDMLAASLTATILAGMLALAFLHHRAVSGISEPGRPAKPAARALDRGVEPGRAKAAEAGPEAGAGDVASPEAPAVAGETGRPAGPPVGAAGEPYVPPLAKAIQHLLTFGRSTVSAIWAGANRVGITIELDRASAEIIRPILQNGGGAGATPGSEGGSCLRILIVESDDTVRQQLRKIIEQHPGYELAEAANGREAVAALEKGFAAELCITAVTMPHMDGIELLRFFRADIRFKTLDVIICTKPEEESALPKAGELHVTDYLLKPLEAEKVWAAIHAIEARIRHQAGSKAHAAERMGIDAESYTALIGTLTEEIAETAAAMRVDLVQGNRHSALTRAHALLGACMNLGDETLMRLTKKVEEALEKGTVEEIMPEIELLESENSRVKALAMHLANRMGSQTAEGGSPSNR